VGSQDTTGLMTSQNSDGTVISPIVDGAYQSGCHTSVWDNKSKNIPRLMKFMNDFGLIARDPKENTLQ
jgi:aconitase B